VNHFDFCQVFYFDSLSCLALLYECVCESVSVSYKLEAYCMYGDLLNGRMYQRYLSTVCQGLVIMHPLIRLGVTFINGYLLKSI
jgi:uncharacterized protein YjaG (DUF416 family)